MTEVFNGGPADRAGLQFSGVILAVDELPVDDPQALRYRIATRMTGGTAQFTVEPGRELHRISRCNRHPMSRRVTRAGCRTLAL